MNSLSIELIESLKTLGLTEYEAKVYSALVLFDKTEVKQIYEYLEAPKPSVYLSLKTLMDKGLVRVISSKPAIYKATPPEIAIKHMIDVHKKAEEKALRELKELEKARIQTELPDAIWTLYGNENVEHNMEELLNKVKRSARLILPDHHIGYLEALRSRDVKLDIGLFGEYEDISKRYGLKNAEIHNLLDLDIRKFGYLLKYISKVPASMEQIKNIILIFVDDEEFMYIPPIPGIAKSGITSKNPFVLGIVMTAFSVIWDNTPEVKQNFF
jgi:sugar-specific transcriptional regulator TrmB